MNRIVAVLTLVVLFLSGCAVDRSSDDVVSAATEAGDADTAEGTSEEAASEGGTEDGVSTTTTIAPFVPPTTGAPEDVAMAVDFGDSTWEITHGELNDLVVPTQENEVFVNLVFRGVPPPDFTLTVLTENLFSQAVLAELSSVGGEVTDADLTTSRDSLLGQVEGLFSTSPDPVGDAESLFESTPYLGFLARYQASQDALTELLADTADPSTGVPCVRHILVDTEAEGQDIVTRLDGGEDFGELAVELSTGPSGPNGGDLGCAPTTGYVAPFAQAVDAAEVGQFVGPVQTEFGWHVLVVDRLEVDGRALATDLLRARVDGATIEIDENLGTWDAERLAILTAG